MTQPTQAPFSQLMLLGGRLCLDFCNTVEYHDSEQPIDLLRRGYPAFVYWCARAKMLESAEVERLLGLSSPPSADSAAVEAVFERVIKLREALYQLFVAAVHDKSFPVEPLNTLNMELAHAYSLRQLAVESSGKLMWTWQATQPAEVPLLPIILSAAELLMDDQLKRVRQCPGCGWLFVDQSKNRSRTWCNMRICGNRAKARQFYQRKKASKQSE